MKTPSLESKTVRPGLSAYSFYHSDRHVKRDPPQEAKPIKKTGKAKRKLLALLVLAVVGFGGYSQLSNNNSQQASITPSGSKDSAAAIAAGQTTEATQPAKTAKINKCDGNDLPQLVLIDITDRHLWACEGNKLVRDYPVITGMQNIEENATPTGTYKIYAKQQDTALSGSASTGTWNEPVSYWMPFLDNQYGTYGFHDASWRKASEFGGTDPYSTKGSHGCIQMNVGNSKWLYNWAAVGATVTITL